MATRARGTFEVKLTPQADDESEGIALGRMTIEKEYEGDLDGAARGEMLTAVSEAHGSAGYVAMERVAGSLGGRAGTFVLQHSGTMSAKGQDIAISIVPDSGTGELEGISGTLTITIKGGEHSYELDYTLPRAKPKTKAKPKARSKKKSR